MLPKHTALFLFSSIVSLGVVAQKPYAITGVSVDPRTGSVPLRQNIDDLYAAGGPQWDLYIRALTAMYEDDSSRALSFFQIAGIHGKPFVAWNDASSKRATGWQGYCPHGEKLFLPWHRPLVLLFEQVLVNHARKIALDYPQRYRYQYIQAAENLRAPYWDWAATSNVPPVTGLSTLQINYPNGAVLRNVVIDNPLATYKLPQAALAGKYGAFDSKNRERTYRCTSPKSYPDSANQQMAERPYKKWLYDAFTRSDDFSEFASTGDSGISLEQIHNAIHWDGACGNQFLDAQYSAFDPLFMLHHSNVDRLWAYWQAIRPDSVVFNQSYTGGSRYSTPGGTIISPGSPLAPFSQSNGAFHTPSSVQTIQGLGYSYIGLEYWNKSPVQMKQDATKLINHLYSTNNVTAPARLVRRDGSYTRYFVRIKFDVSELERPCSVDVYVKGHHAGGLIVMEQPATGIMNGAFALDDAVEAAGAHKRAVDATVNSIQSSLEIQISKRDGSRTQVSSVKSLRVELEDVSVTPPSTEHQLPRYSSPRRRPAFATERFSDDM